MEAQRINKKGWWRKHFKSVLYPAIFFVLAITMAISMTAPVSAAITTGNSTNANSGTGMTITIAKPSGTVTGDMLVACIVATTFFSDVWVTPPDASWQLIRTTNANQSGHYYDMVTYYKVAGSSEPSSYTFTSSEWNASGGITRLTGVDVNHPVDVSAESQGQGNTDLVTASAPSVTTTYANDLVINFFGSYTALADSNSFIQGSYSPALTPLYEYVIPYPGSGSYDIPSIASYDWNMASAGSTGSRDCRLDKRTSAAGLWWVAQTIAFKAAPRAYFPTASTTASEANTGYWAGVNLNSNAQGPVEVNFTVSGTAKLGTDFSMITTSPLTINTGSSSASIGFNVLEDNEYEVDETIIITIEPSSEYYLSGNTQFTYTITNDDGSAPAPIISYQNTNGGSGGIGGVSNHLLGIAKPAGTAPGDFLLACIVNRTDITHPGVTAPEGWTLIGTTLNSPNRITTFYRFVGTSPGTDPDIYSFTIGTAGYIYEDHATGTIVRYTGIDTVNPVDVVGGAAGSDTSAEGPSVHPSYDNGRLVTVFGSYVPEAFSTPSGMTLLNFVHYHSGDTWPVDTWPATYVFDQAWSPASPTGVKTSTVTQFGGHGVQWVAQSLVLRAGSPMPSVGFNISASTAAENNTVVNLAVQLSASRATPVTVNYAISGGTATGGGVDYTLVAGTLTFAPGDTLEYVPITVVNDGVNEPNETIQVTLSSPSGAVLGANTVYTYTIQNDDPTVYFTSSGSAGDESTATVNLQVNLSFAATIPVSVNYAVNPAGTTAKLGADYTLSSGILNFAAGETSKNIVLSIINDAEYENVGETVQVTLSSPTGASLGSVVSYTYTINANDSPAPTPIISYQNTNGASGGIGGVSNHLLGIAKPAGTAPGDFLLACIVNMTDYTHLSVTPPVGWTLIGTTLSGPTRVTTFYRFAGTSPGTDPDTYSFTIGTATYQYEDHATGTIVRYTGIDTTNPVDVWAGGGGSSTSAEGPSVHPSYDNGRLVTVFGSYVPAGFSTPSGMTLLNSVHFHTGETNYVDTWPATYVFDQAWSPASPTGIRTSTITQFGGHFEQWTTQSLVLRAAPPLALSINDVTIAEGDQGGTHNAIFTVTLSASSPTPVTFTWLTQDGTATGDFPASSYPDDYQISGVSTPSFETIPAGQTTYQLYVPIVPDAILESNETFFVNLTGSSGAIISDSQGIGTIANDDSTLSINDVTLSEGNSGTTNAVFTVTLSNASVLTVSADYISGGGSATAGSDYSNLSGTLTIAAGLTTGTISIPVIGDTTYESNENFNVTLISATGAHIGDGVGVGTINNDDLAPVNVAPVATDVTTSTNEDTAKAITLTATDADGNPLTFSIVGNPSHGALGTVSGNSVTYTPAANYNGSDSFTFKANDGTVDSNTATVNITINAVNDAPVATNVTTSTNEDTAKAITLTATDVDGNPLTYSIIGSPSHGTLGTVSGSSVTYTPAANYYGSDSFTFKANDGTVDSNIATVNITITSVNDLPVADGKTVSTDFQTNKTITLTGSDIETRDLFFAIVTQPAHGSLIDIINSPGSWTIPFSDQADVIYSPNGGFSGTDSFTYKVVDENSGDSNVATVNITVNPSANVAPVLGAIGPKNINELVALIFTATATDADLPANTLTFSLADGTSGIVPSGASINSSTGAFSWTPTEAQGLGSYTFDVVVSDGALTDYETITVTVAEVNVAPVLAAIGPKNINELVALTFTATATDADLPANTKTFSLADGTSGDVPSGASINSSTGAFSWTPTEAQGPGSYTFDVVVSDGTATDFETITVTVAEVNVVPVLAAIGPKNINELVALTFTATATDADLPANTLTFSLADGTSGDVPSGASINSSTGAFSWTPTEAQGPGSFTFDVVVSDGALTDFETITVTVNEVNVAPVLAVIGPKSVNELATLGFTATAGDTDVPVQTLTFSLVGAPSGASITPGGVFSWTPTEAQGPHAPYTFTVQVTDGTLTDTESITVTVIEVNVAPVLAAIGPKSVNELATLSFTATAGDTDLPVQTLIFSLVGAPSGASISAFGVFSWTPTEAQGPGPYTFTVQVTDATLTDTESITVTVNEVNVAPVLASIGNKNVNELGNLTFTATATDADLPVNTLTFSLADGTSGDVPSGASINSSTGAFSWTPTEAQGPGSFTFDVVVSDGALTDFETITVTVNEVNVAPVLAVIGPKSVNELATLGFTATAGDTDVPVQTLTFSLVGAPSGASITPGGVFSWTPTEAQGPHAPYTFTVQVTDGTLTDTESITVTVIEVNVAPVLAAIGPKSVNELATLSFTATAGDTDLPVQTLIFSLVGAPSGASISAFGVFSWTPTEAQGPGPYTFTVQVTDATLTDTESITVTVNEVNVAPVLASIGNRNVNELVALTFTATATDADLPANTFTFSLADGTSGDVPSGASINSSTGAFSWTPTEAQGPGSFTFDVVVSDGTATDFETITVTVAEVNVAPVLGTIGNKNVNELAALTFTATATDADLPANTKTFSLADGISGDVPSGTSINSSTGAFSWTPTEAQGPGTYTFDVVVSDGALTDFETITITVAEVNVAPVFTFYPDGSGFPELAIWGSAVTATDADVPTQTLTFSLIGAPAGMTIHPTIGNVTWTPTEAQGPGNYSFTIRVSDGVTNTDVTGRVSVVEVNVAPVLGVIGPKNVNELLALTFTATATDTDLPANSKTFSLADGTSGDVPGGASINSSTGAFSWTPTEAQGPGTYTFDVVVSDGTATDFETITVTVAEVNVAPVLGAIGPKSVNEGSALTFTATATDADIPANTKTFSLADGTSGDIPSGASISSSTGAFSWTPADGNSTATFDVVVSDGALTDSETIIVTVNNVAPVVDAGAATASIDENTTFTRSGSFTDPGDDTWTATVDYGDGGGTVALTLTGKTFNLSHTYADNGVYTVTVTVTETDLEEAYGSDTITVTVNNVAPISDGDPETQNVQYSDPIATITIEATDVIGDTLVASTQWKLGAASFDDGLFDDLTLSSPYTPVNNGDGTSTTTWTIDGIANVAPGVYTIRITVTDEDLDSDYYDVTITVTKEAAVITFDSGNIVAQPVTASGSGVGNLDGKVFTVYVSQQADSHPGSQLLTEGSATARLVPVGGGSPIDLVRQSFEIGDFASNGGKATYTFGYTGTIPLETYTLEVKLTDTYYTAAPGEDAFVVYDPTSAFTTGGGWFNWPQDGSPLAGAKTNFGFTMKYNNKGQQVQGSLLIIAHLPDGSIYRIKSNALNGLALNNLTGIATFSGKCTYLYPNPIPGGDPINVGGQEFMIYIDDNNNPGDGIDQFWFNVLGQPFSLDTDNDNQADSQEILPITGGNIVAPHIAAGQVTNPTVTLVNPDEGIRGSTIQVVTITGTGFNGATKVSFGAGITVTELTVVSDTEISVKITISSKTKAGTRDVTVTTSGGSGTLKGGFTVS
ncbi:tandem-95 repeat protein [Dehalogenimonas etheniformans]|uniref:tandem-95 repeat protein n=1 Tax=Dehalogenimonas etheniformans TaxID=1536648 RepID=UPI00167F41CE|nr:tandem-95 repeat protein [Dehalogenimonas etheniformans]QNT77021.1 tandem-95 repeat protein [Dehalogenimonas etheniformans]